MLNRLLIIILIKNYIRFNLKFDVYNKMEDSQHLKINTPDTIDSNIPKTKKVFIGGIPINIGQGIKKFNLDELENFLSKFGKLNYCRLAKKKDGSLKGFGFAEYETLEEAKSSHGFHYLKGLRVRLIFYKNQQLLI